ncbi:MAG: hypothetical protein ACD_75C02533G0002 [uncultured bacterium]|nr:MAG: hypothetical protein ACD_75C02533G0002 [uncultured bacterium]
MLNERHFKVQASIRNRIADRSAELGDYHLFAFFQNEEAVVDQDNRQKDETCEKKLCYLFHVCLHLQIIALAVVSAGPSTGRERKDSVAESATAGSCR